MKMTAPTGRCPYSDDALEKVRGKSEENDRGTDLIHIYDHTSILTDVAVPKQREERDMEMGRSQSDESEPEEEVVERACGDDTKARARREGVNCTSRKGDECGGKKDSKAEAY